MARTSVTYFYMTGVHCTDRTQAAPAQQVSTSTPASLSFSYSTAQR